MKLLPAFTAATAIISASTICHAFRGGHVPGTTLSSHHHHQSARRTEFVALHASSSSSGKSGKFSDQVDGIINGHNDANDLEEKVSVDDVILGVLEGADLEDAEDDSVDIDSAMVNGDAGVAGAHFVRGEADGEVIGAGVEQENEDGEDEDDDEETKQDKEMMRQAIFMAQSGGGERGTHGPFPRPICGAVLVAKDGRVSLAGFCIAFWRDCFDFSVVLNCCMLKSFDDSLCCTFRRFLYF